MLLNNLAIKISFEPINVTQNRNGHRSCDPCLTAGRQKRYRNCEVLHDRQA